MKHKSVALPNSPVEFINITPLNPLISQCQIKVCYVGDEANRNKSIITKDTAREMANSLPGCPIVGFYNEAKEDFEEHNRIIDISNGNFEIKDTTKPYGFVDMNAKVWFQKFLDDDENEHEYLMTEGYLWTSQYPECQRIIEHGNNQSMELDPDTLDATWSKDDNGKPQFFIINEAIISKLCILGEDSEPCFEGSQITEVQFSFDEGFKQQLFSMMKELKDFLDEGGTKVFNRYAVEIGDELWGSLHRYLVENHPDPSDGWCSIYSVEGIYEENSQKFAILRHRQDMKYYRLNFNLSESEGFQPVDKFIEVTKTYQPAETPQFEAEAVKAYELEYKKQKEEEEEKENQDKTGKNDDSNSDNNSEGENKEENDDEEEKKKKEKTFASEEGNSDEPIQENYSLEDLQAELNSLKEEKEKLESQFSALNAEKTELEETLASLVEFKASVEREKKQEMIASFYMLSDDDKKDVIENIDTYSLDDIEAKLSIICVRNKVSFNLEDDIVDKNEDPTVFNLDSADADENVPAWIKAVREVEKTMNN